MKTILSLIAVGLAALVVGLAGCNGGGDAFETVPQAVQDDFAAFAERYQQTLASTLGAAKPSLAEASVVRVAGQDTGTCILNVGPTQYDATLTSSDGKWQLATLRFFTPEGDVKEADEALKAKFAEAAERANQK
jgi:hypothetical protein